MKTYFLDSGFLIDLASSEDQHHPAAAAFWQEIQKERVSFVTTTYVLDEVATFFNSRGHHAKAVAVGESLLNSKTTMLIHVDESIFTEALREFTHHADKRYSLTDCVSFVVMKRHKLRRALAFDRHFAQAGFERIP